MKKILFNIIILLALCGCGDGKREFVESEFETTVDNAHKTNNPELIFAYMDHTSSMPDISRANAYAQIGILFAKNKEDKKALEYYEKSLTAVGDKNFHMAALIRGVALYELAKIHMKNKDYKSARQAYVDLLKNHQQYPDLKLNCIRIYQEIAFIDACMRDYKSERQIFMKILYIQENNSKYNSEDIATTHGLIAQSYNRSKDYANSVKWSKKAIQCLSKGNADKYVSGMIYYTYAVSLYNKMQKKDAVKQLKTACNFFSENKSPSALAKLKHSLLLLTKWQKDDGG